MLNIKTVALAAALTFSAGGVAFADQSAMEALSSASSVSFQTVQGPEVVNVKPGGPRGDLVDIGSLKSRIANDPGLLAQLEAYGATIDDIVGITGTSETDVTIYVEG